MKNVGVAFLLRQTLRVGGALPWHYGTKQPNISRMFVQMLGFAIALPNLQICECANKKIKLYSIFLLAHFGDNRSSRNSTKYVNLNIENS